ncbi:MAG: sulfatase-like hydrolase/transferase [Phycisphaerae bacterium]|nr:sulfatase-like hydrolase/transferase [Phycisphaerae bacterium]
MNRRSFLKSLSAGVGCLVSTGCVTVMGRSAGKRPDVLFIAIDDMNDWTTLFDPRNPIKTPNLVCLARRGMFSNTTAKPQNDPGSLKKMVQSYQASADFADQMVGRLLDKLDATGQAASTIIVLRADHGYHLGDKESCVKFTLWEKANHIPFIIVAPGVTKAGSRCDRPVSLIDIYPTLVDLAGLPPKQDVDGKSLVPLLTDPTKKWQPVLMTMGKGNHAVRSDRWRYILYKDGSQELYDHAKDPWEWNNLASQPEYAEVIDEHKKWLPTNEK